MFNKKLKVLMLVSCLALTACQSADEKVAVYVANAKEHIAKGDYDAAHIEFRNALQIDPNHVEALYEVTKVFEQDQDWAQIHRYLERVLELQPDHLEALLAIGGIELSLQQLDSALARSDKAMELSPDSAKVRAFNAVVRLKLGDAEGAVAEAKKALEIDSGNIDAVVVLAAERLEANQPKQAIDYLHKYADSDVLILQAMRVRAYNEEKDLAGAVSVFEKLISIDPDNEEYFLGLVKQYLLFNEKSKAEAVFKRLINTQPDNIEAKVEFAKFLYQFMGAGRAIVMLNQELQAFPSDLRLNFALVQIYQETARLDDAKLLLQEISTFEDQQGALRALNRLAKIEFEEGNEEAGNSYLKTVLARDSKNEEAIVLNAQRKLLEGGVEQAIAELRSVLKDNPDSGIVLALLGQAHEQQGKRELALDQYSRAYRAEPSNTMVVLAYTRALYALRQYGQLEQVLEAYLKLKPSDIDALKMAADTKLTLQKWEEAELIADRLDKINAAAVEADQIRGTALLGMRKNAESIQAFERAYETAEDKARPMLALVRSYVASKRNNEAKSFLQAVLSKDPDNLNALSLIAQLYQLEGDMVSAEQALRMAQKGHPENKFVYQRLSGFLIRGGKLSEAYDVLEQGIGQVTDNETLLFVKAGLLQSENEMGQAVEVYEQILTKKPDFDVAANNLAVIFAEPGQYQDLKRAKQLAKRFRNSKVPHFQDTLGRIYYLEGDTNNALYFHESAVDAMPELAEFRYHLGMSYKAAGESIRAKQELVKALELAKSETPLWKDEVSKIVDQM